MTINRTKLSEFEKDGRVFRLFIESYEFPAEGIDINLTETYGIITDIYEIGCSADNALFYDDLSYSIDEVEGRAFYIEAMEDGPIEMNFITIFTEWEYDEHGDVENIIVPDEPYDEGTFELEEGSYRVWDEVEEV